MTVPDKVIEAVREHWGVQSDIEEKLYAQELHDDWILWRREDAGKAGGMRLVVPKQGMTPFEIPSNAFADDQHGVSWDYEMILQQSVSINQDIASIIQKHTGMSLSEVYKFLKVGLSSHAYFILAPLELIRELKKRDVYLKLVRPGSQGEYS